MWMGQPRWREGGGSWALENPAVAALAQRQASRVVPGSARSREGLRTPAGGGGAGGGRRGLALSPADPGRPAWAVSALSALSPFLGNGDDSASSCSVERVFP